jgi:hypothetical protein
MDSPVLEWVSEWVLVTGTIHIEPSANRSQREAARREIGGGKKLAVKFTPHEIERAAG